MSFTRFKVLLCGLAITLSGCASINGARPLGPGQHEFGVTFGGAVIEFMGAPIPIPNLVVEGRSGITKLANRELDLNYGLNITGLPFGIMQLHVGASWLLAHPKGAVPALSMTNRLWFANNGPGASYKSEGAVGVWASHQLEFTVSWMLGQHLLYVALAQYTDFLNPALTLTPAIGATFDGGQPGGFKFQLEARYFALNQTQAARPFTFVPGAPGAIGISFGFIHAF